MHSIEIELIPILDDNYVFLLQNKQTGKTALVDPGDADPCLRSLKAKRKNLDFIIVTHHHADHIDGIVKLKEQFPNVLVYAPSKNKNQIPHVDFFVNDGELLRLPGLVDLIVVGLPGHTLGHVAYYSKLEKVLFSGDVLFGLGCGRIFEGSFEMSYQSLQKLKDLPDDTRVFCTHEYTNTNLKFVEELIETQQLSAEYNLGLFNEYKKNLVHKRNRMIPSVPLILRAEKCSNPMLFASSVEEFSKFRKLRNDFKPQKKTPT